MFILRKDDRIWIRTNSLAHRPEREMRPLLASYPEIDCKRCTAAFDDGLGETDLTVKFQRPRLHRERSRCRSGLHGLVDNPDADAQVRQPEGKNQAGWPSSDNENIGFSVGRYGHACDTPVLVFVQSKRQTILRATL